MKLESKIPANLALGTETSLSGDVHADVYVKYDRPVAIVLWRGNEPQPFAAFRGTDEGQLVRFALTANDDLPAYDRRDVLRECAAEFFVDPATETVRGVALYQGEAGTLSMMVSGSAHPMQQYAFNLRNAGLKFDNDFRDRDGLPLSDAIGATMRAILQGRAGRRWELAPTAKLIADYSSAEMQRILDVVNVRCRDQAWALRYEESGLIGTDELAEILANRWAKTFVPANKLPVVAVQIEDDNTFSFYVNEGAKEKTVSIHQYTDFRGTSLEDDFPFGSFSQWTQKAPKDMPDMEVIDRAGRSLLKDWHTLPKTFPAAEAPPYDYNDIQAEQLAPAGASDPLVLHDLPGMWHESDFMGGATDCEPQRPDLDDRQRSAVEAFRSKHGADWKERLSVAWSTGNYRKMGVSDEQAALLQQVRNRLGPEWLETYGQTPDNGLLENMRSVLSAALVKNVDDDLAAVYEAANGSKGTYAEVFEWVCHKGFTSQTTNNALVDLGFKRGILSTQEKEALTLAEAAPKPKRKQDPQEAEHSIEPQ